MSAELHQSKPATRSLQKIFLDQVSNAAVALDKQRLTDSAVHEVRKQLKKARATLRLLRPAMGDAYRRENAIVRDIARPLSAIRDGRVLLDTLDNLLRRYGPTMEVIRPASFRHALDHDLAARRRHIMDSCQAMDTQRESLKKLRSRSAHWRVPKGNWSILGAGLKQVYAAGRKALKKAVEEGSAERFHELRKQAKYLRHQLELLQPIWCGPIRELTHQLHDLTDHLGEDHDLVVLEEKLAAYGESFQSESERWALSALIDRRSGRLREKAAKLGRRIYEEKPSAFEARFHGYWRAWHH